MLMMTSLQISKELLFHQVQVQFALFCDLVGDVDGEDSVEDDVGQEGFFQAQGFQFRHNVSRFYVEVLLLPILDVLLHVNDQLLQFLAPELQRVHVEKLFCRFLLLFFLLLQFLSVLVMRLLCFLYFFLLFLLLACCHVFRGRRVFEDVGCKFVFVIEFAGEGAGVALASDDVVDYDHVHFGEFAFGTADVLFDKFVKNFKHIAISELPVDNVIGIVLTSSLLECGLRGLLKAEKLKYVLRVCSQILCYIV